MTDRPTDRDPIRQARLDSLGVLLTRVTNGLTLTQEEARLLVDHVGTEVRDGTTARELASAAAAADSADKEQHMTDDTPDCTATIDGPHVPGDSPVPCTRKAHGRDGHVGPEGAHGKVLWNDDHAGAVPHGAATEKG